MNQRINQDTHEGQYYCGICGWVDLSLFPHCHETPVKMNVTWIEILRIAAFVFMTILLVATMIFAFLFPGGM
jgi:hypothetical protein